MSNKVLLIEDDAFISDLYKHVLEKGGFSVLQAFDGETGVKICEENPDADIVLLDVMLPKMNGLDVLKKIKENEGMKHLIVIILSNLGEEYIIQSALQVGARDYFKKVQLAPERLVEAVNGYIKFPEYKFPKLQM